MKDKLPLKWAWSGLRDPLFKFGFRAHISAPGDCYLRRPPNVPRSFDGTS